MAIKLSQEIEVFLKDNGNKFVNRDDVDFDRAVVDNEYVSKRIKLADGTTDYQVSFDGLSDVTFLYISVNGEISFKVNDVNGTSIKLNNLNPSVLNSKDITALYLSNNSGSDVDVELILCKQEI